MRDLSIGVAVLILSAGPVHGQTAADTAFVTEAVTKLFGTALTKRLGDSTGAVFRRDTSGGTWTGGVFTAIRDAFPATARTVADTAHAVWFGISPPSFRGDTAEVGAGWSQCYVTGALADPVAKLMNYGGSQFVYRFVRIAPGQWRRVAGSETLFDGSCKR